MMMMKRDRIKGRNQFLILSIFISVDQNMLAAKGFMYALYYAVKIYFMMSIFLVNVVQNKTKYIELIM